MSKLALAQANQINATTYKRRISAGWSPEEAATLKPGQPRKWRPIPERAAITLPKAPWDEDTTNQ